MSLDHPLGGVYDPRAYGARCDVCPLRGSKVIQPEWAHLMRRKLTAGAEVHPVAVVVDTPSVNDVKEGRLLSGPSGYALDNALFASGVKREGTLLITSASLCLTEVKDDGWRKPYDPKSYMMWLRAKNKIFREGNKQAVRAGYAPVPLLENPFACCAPRLERELQIAEDLASSQGGTLVVAPSGPFANGSVFGTPGKSLSPTKWRGSVLTSRVT